MRNVLFNIWKSSLLSKHFNSKFYSKSFFLNKKEKYSKVFIEQIANNLAAWLLDSSNTKKSFDWWVCLTIPAKNANLLPPVGPFLGQHGFNTMGFCTNFNTITKNFPDSLPLKVFIKLYTDKTIQFQIKTPPVSFLLYSAYLNNNSNGIKIKDLFKVIFIKRIENNDLTINSMLPTIMGTAWSMKIKIVK